MTRLTPEDDALGRCAVCGHATSKHGTNGCHSCLMRNGGPCWIPLPLEHDGGCMDFTPKQKAEREAFVNHLRSDLQCKDGESIRQAIQRWTAEIDDNERTVKDRDEWKRNAEGLAAEYSKDLMISNARIDGLIADNERYRATIVQLEKERVEAVERADALETSLRQASDSIRHRTGFDDI